MAKRALVLSGGGLFAAFQAGAWRAVAPHFRPDIVVGASAGALNAWLIASCIPPEELCRLWLKVDRDRTCVAQLRLPRFWGDGILDTCALEELLKDLTTRYKPRIPLAVQVCEGLKFQTRVYRNEDLTLDHLLASCAVPLLLPAKRLNGKISFDGGLREVCPIQAAWDFGATEILAIDVWTHLPWWWRPLRKRSVVNKGVLRITPGVPLGPLRSAALWQPNAIERWIAQGESDARKALSRRR